MNLNNLPTVAELQCLIAKCNDLEENHVIWVRDDGEVFVEVRGLDESSGDFRAGNPRLKFRYETYTSGNGYVGENASQDLAYISELLERLKIDWVKDRRGYLDY